MMTETQLERIGFVASRLVVRALSVALCMLVFKGLNFMAGEQWSWRAFAWVMCFIYAMDAFSDHPRPPQET